MPKAGSTTIQTSLLRNADSLAAHGVSYTTADPNVSSDYQLYELLVAGRLDELSVLVDSRLEDAASSGAGTVVFSAERLFTLALDPNAMSNLLRVFKERSSEFEIVIVVRPLVPFLSSYLTQLIDNGMFFIQDLGLAHWCAASIRTFWNLPERVTAISLEQASHDLPSVFLSAIGSTAEITASRENVSSTRSLAFHAASGLVCRLFSLTTGNDVNSPEAYQLRVTLQRQYDEAVAQDGTGAAFAAFDWLGTAVSRALHEYIAMSMGRVDIRDRILVDELTTSLVSRNYQTATDAARR